MLYHETQLTIKKKKKTGCKSGIAELATVEYLLSASCGQHCGMPSPNLSPPPSFPTFMIKQCNIKQIFKTYLKT